jgi:bifunctional DNA-binding transcriptional regulator/antitoxin component of YhaV-PrlF toxin-antitoxin module
MNTERWTITAEEDPETGDIVLPLPEELLKKVGWKEGDTLEWIDNHDGSWSIEKVKDDKKDLL